MDGLAFQDMLMELKPAGVQLLAVSKTKSVEDIFALYNLGQRDFGENYVQELVEKQPLLPADIRWHFIGHLQSNKVKYLAGFVHLIQGVDSEKLLSEIDKQAAKAGRVCACLLQVFIAREESKFGFSETGLRQLLQSLPEQRAAGRFQHIQLAGLMGMASNTEDPEQVRREFHQLHQLFESLKTELPGEPFEILSMGMSGDYGLAIDEGSTMVRIGTRLFGQREPAR